MKVFRGSTDNKKKEDFAGDISTLLPT